MRNASVGFDVAQHGADLRLRLDVPGASSALLVAERFGLSRGIVERARSVVPEQSKHFDALVSELATRLGQVDAQRSKLHEELARVERDRGELDTLLTAKRRENRRR